MQRFSTLQSFWVYQLHVDIIVNLYDWFGDILKRIAAHPR